MTVVIDKPDRQPRARPRFAVSLLLAVVASVAVWALLRVVNYTLPYLQILAVCLGVSLMRWALAQVAEPVWRHTRDLVRSPRVRRRLEPGEWYEGGDGVTEAVRRWDRRLEWGDLDGQRWAHTVGRQLGALVDERLRQRYGITRATHPERARQLVGERVWALLGPLQRPPTPRQVNAALTDLETMPEGEVGDERGAR